jgi:DNA-binding Lrp family transcriptional regulator
MVTAIVLLKVAKTRMNSLAEELAGIKEVSEVFSVTGRYDLVAILRVATNDDLAQCITDRMLKLEGIEKTYTMLAFKAYSKHDLEAMFCLE